MEINEFIRTIRSSGTSLAINIPPEIIRLMKLKKGDIINVKLGKIKENDNK
jgi:antitoxin component of MazEF toxin-antitoxin module